MAGSEAEPRRHDFAGITLPAWKRDILERRKAKGTSPGGGGSKREKPGSPSRERGSDTLYGSRGRTNSPGPRRTVNSGHHYKDISLRSTGRQPSPNSPQLRSVSPSSALRRTGSPGRPLSSSSVLRRSGSPGRPLSPSSPRRRSASPGRPLSPSSAHRRSSSPGRSLSPSSPRSPLSPSSLFLLGDRIDAGESLVLQESIGPIQENLFIKLEKERRRQQQEAKDNGGPVQHLIELYGNVPGIRTIRADNIIIIESDPQFFQDRRDSWNLKNGDINTINSLNQLLARRGSKVAEIRASEVIICEPSLDQSEHEFTIFGAEDGIPHSNGLDSWGSHGIVSRLLEKFDGTVSKSVKSRSTENLILDKGDLLHRNTEDKSPTLPKSPTTVVGHQRGQAAIGITTNVNGDSSFQFHNSTNGFTAKNSELSPSKTSCHNTSRSVMDSPICLPSEKNIPSSSSAVITEPPTPENALSKEREFSNVSVSSFRKRLENYPASNNQKEQKKDFTRNVGGSTFTVNPRAKDGGHFKMISSEKVPLKDNKTLFNGQIIHSELDLISADAIMIQEVTSEAGKEERASLVNGIDSESRQVPSAVSASSKEMFDRASERRPKSKVDTVKPSHSSSGSLPGLPKNDSKGLRSSATQPVTPKPSQNDGSISATPNQLKAVSASTSLNDSFQIKPAPKPDIASIPDDDIQAKALANIKAQSRNSFVVVPKKRPVPSLLLQDDETERETPQKPKKKDTGFTTLHNTSLPYDVLSQSSAHSSNEGSHSTLKSVLQRSDLADGKGKAEVNISATSPTSVQSNGDYIHLHPNVDRSPLISDDPEFFRRAKEEKDGPRLLVMGISTEISRLEEDLPVTNIDDIVETSGREVNNSEVQLKEPSSSLSRPQYRDSGGPSSVFQRKNESTFTVLPNKKSLDWEQRTSVILKGTESEGEPTSPPGKESVAPFREIGMLLKKRYPGVDEIEVIGGYMSLGKSCLYKTGSTRKKMKISFNDGLLKTFEYPPESSLTEDSQEEEEEEAHESGNEAEEEDEEKPTLLFIPRPRYLSSPMVSATLRPHTVNAGLSSYTPKHSVEFSTWQEQKYEEKVANWRTSQEPPSQQDSMLTPADSSSLSDYSSEPALYF
ncbi:taperin [Protopterus annectens]|uniref:taperin n=1 Tax=Protopterus annectens TaxID=7888 RepID=UPI001CF95FAA|nr:taperin [Protopterus annectens]